MSLCGVCMGEPNVIYLFQFAPTPTESEWLFFLIVLSLLTPLKDTTFCFQLYGPFFKIISYTYCTDPALGLLRTRHDQATACGHPSRR
jgi:hypothetical protein